jgi:hypothetical protein
MQKTSGRSTNQLYFTPLTKAVILRACDFLALSGLQHIRAPAYPTS